MSSTSKRSHRSIFSSLTSSSRSSTNSASSSSARSTPLGCRDFRLRYAKDAKGHDFTPSYAYGSAASSSASEVVFPVSCRDSLRLRYAKDSKGHDFAESFPAQFGKLREEEEVALLAAAAATAMSVPAGARDYKRRVNRYAKDGRGVDFEKSYRY